MENFLKIAENIDIFPLLLAIHRQPDLWNAVPLRTQTPGSPHASASDVLIRFQPLDGSLKDPRACVWYDAASRLPQVRPMVYGLMARVEGDRLGRIMLAKLEPGHNIQPHSDVGEHPLQYERVPYWGRYHIPLTSDPCVIFRCGQEFLHMQPGEAWHFKNYVEHEVFWTEGYGPETPARIHLIVDIHTANEPDREEPC
jgi:hypothetical protein